MIHLLPNVQADGRTHRNDGGTPQSLLPTIHLTLGSSPPSQGQVYLIRLDELEGRERP